MNLSFNMNTINLEWQTSPCDNDHNWLNIYKKNTKYNIFLKDFSYNLHKWPEILSQYFIDNRINCTHKQCLTDSKLLSMPQNKCVEYFFFYRRKVTNSVENLLENTNYFSGYEKNYRFLLCGGHIWKEINIFYFY